MDKLLVLDIGGTFIKSATWNGKLSDVKETPTPQTYEEFVSTIKELIKEVEPISGIGISFAGQLDSKTGMKYLGGTLRYLDNTNLIEMFNKEFGLKAALENDSKSATLAEMQSGCLVGVDNSISIVLGTGVGGTVVVNGEILNGSSLVAGELSFLSTDINAPIEFAYLAGQLCSTTGLIQLVEEKTGQTDLNGKKIFKQLEEGNDIVKECIQTFAKRVAWLIYNFSFITNPDVIAIGGGVSNQDVLIDMIREEVNNYIEATPIRLKAPEIRVCEYKNSANLIGAGINYLKHYGLDISDFEK